MGRGIFGLSISMFKHVGRLFFTTKQEIFGIHGLPSVYNTGCYVKVLESRLLTKEDEKMAELARKIISLKRPLAKEWYPTLAVQLLHSYPLLRRKHGELFERLRNKARQSYDDDPSEFVLCMLLVGDFIGPEGSHRVETFETLEDGLIGPYDNPIEWLEVLHTLRVFGDKEPFCFVSFLKDEMENVESLLANYDLYKFVKMAEPGPRYLKDYIDQVDAHL